MAMLPESARTAAAYLGGGIARGIEQKGAQVAQAGMKAAESASSGVGQKVGQFYKTLEARHSSLVLLLEPKAQLKNAM